MKNLKLIVLLTLVLATTSCSRSESKTPFVFSPSKEPGIVAKFNEIKITESEIEKGIESELYEEKMKIYQMKFDKLKEIVSLKLMGQDSKSKGMSRDQYFEKYVFEKVADKEIDAFIKERNLPKEQITPDIRERIKTIVQGEKNSGSIDRWISKQLGSESIEVYFEKPLRPTFNVAIGNSPVMGILPAAVTIVEFSDFQCPHCARAKEIVDQIKKKYKNDVAVVFKNYPLPFHTQAKLAAVAGLCAHEQNSKDGFTKMHDYMFANQSKLGAEDLKAAAKATGLDSAKFDQCLTSAKHEESITADMNQANELGVKSTPTFFINGKLLMGAQPLEVFSELIDEELKTLKK